MLYIRITAFLEEKLVDITFQDFTIVLGKKLGKYCTYFCAYQCLCIWSNMVLQSGPQPSVLVWECANLTFISELKGHLYGVECIAFSPDG